MTILTSCPPIPIKFDPHLLSMPTFGFSAKKLQKIAEFLKKKVNSGQFKKFPRTKNNVYLKYMYFMELYAQVKNKEYESKGKAFIKANAPFYRPRLADSNDQRLLERLDNRRKTSEFDRRHNKIQTTWEVK